MNNKLTPSERQWLAQTLSNSLIQENLYNRITERRDQAYRNIITSTGAEDLFRSQGKLATWDEIIRIFKELKGE